MSLSKVDANPIGSGGQVNLTSMSGWKSLISLFVGMVIFLSVLLMARRGAEGVVQTIDQNAPVDTGADPDGFQVVG